MTESPTAGLLQRVRTTLLAGDGGGRTDADLVDDFVARRDEAAFAALVRRHGPMV